MFYLLISDDPRGGGNVEYKNKDYGKVASQQAKREAAVGGEYCQIVSDNKDDAEEYDIEYMDKQFLK